MEVSDILPPVSTIIVICHNSWKKSGKLLYLWYFIRRSNPIIVDCQSYQMPIENKFSLMFNVTF